VDTHTHTRSAFNNPGVQTMHLAHLFATRQSKAEQSKEDCDAMLEELRALTRIKRSYNPPSPPALLCFNGISLCEISTGTGAIIKFSL